MSRLRLGQNYYWRFAAASVQFNGLTHLRQYTVGQCLLSFLDLFAHKNFITGPARFMPTEVLIKADVFWHVFVRT